jgi:hypothetical protein
MEKTIRQQVPDRLALWLDAYSIEGEEDFGKPGFESLRLAWTGRIPATEAMADLDEWLANQQAHQEAAQAAYERLFEAEPILSDENGEVVVPAWFATWWGEVLTSHPWDESLNEAVVAALAYLDDIASPAASVKESIDHATDGDGENREQNRVH